MLASPGGVDGAGLVRVQACNALLGKTRLYRRAQRPLKLARRRVTRRDVLYVLYLLPVPGKRLDVVKEGTSVHDGAFKAGLSFAIEARQRFDIPLHYLKLC